MTGSHEAIRAALQLVQHDPRSRFGGLPWAPGYQARLWIAQGHLEAAESLLDRLHRAAAAVERNGSLIEILILQAITFEAQNRGDEALSALE